MFDVDNEVDYDPSPSPFLNWASFLILEIVMSLQTVVRSSPGRGSQPKWWPILARRLQSGPAAESSPTRPVIIEKECIDKRTESVCLSVFLLVSLFIPFFFSFRSFFGAGWGI